MFYNKPSTSNKSSNRFSRFLRKLGKVNININHLQICRLHFAGRGGKGHFVSSAIHNWNRKGRW